MTGQFVFVLLSDLHVEGDHLWYGIGQTVALEQSVLCKKRSSNAVRPPNTDRDTGQYNGNSADTAYLRFLLMPRACHVNKEHERSCIVAGYVLPTFSVELRSSEQPRISVHFQRSCSSRS